MTEPSVDVLVPETEFLVALVRPPIVSTVRALNNEATPSVALAYISAGLKAAGYEVEVIDAIAEGLNRCWPLSQFPGYQGQGLTFDEILERIPLNSRVIGVSAMFSGEWPCSVSVSYSKHRVATVLKVFYTNNKYVVFDNRHLPFDFFSQLISDFSKKGRKVSF